MDFEYTEDQRALSTMARQVLTEHSLDEIRALQDGGLPTHSTVLWKSLAATGLLGLAFSEADGGSGGTLLDAGVLFREAGRAITPTTLRTTTFAGVVIERLGSPAQRADLIGRIAIGDLIATVAVAEPGTDGTLDHLGTTAVAEGEGWWLTGSKTYVENAVSAELVVVAARTEQGIGSFLVQAGDPGVRVDPVAVGSRDEHAHLHLERAPATLLGDLGDATGYRSAMEVIDALRAAEMLGVAELALERTSAYVSTREQFGRPIGSFQAVQHVVANMATDVRVGRALTFRALWLLAHGQDASAAVAGANFWMGRGGVATTLAAHQVHGGMGYVLESGLYLYSERARALALQSGSTTRQLALVADQVLSGGR